LATLEVRGLCAGYGRAQVLFDASFEAQAGEVVALLGRNGAGKSTLLKSIMRLVPASSGQVILQQESISALQPHEIAQRGLGYVPEDRRIFTDLTVAENLEVGRQAPRSGAPAWDDERLFALFPALAPLRDRPGARMSGGEQQMLAIARTLAGNPQAILLDEPTEGLAPVVVAQLAAAIGELKGAGVSVVLAEQNLRFAQRVADRTYALEKGVLHAQ
jgi:branched-chain amino acid transport system ATP-binding protein